MKPRLSVSSLVLLLAFSVGSSQRSAHAQSMPREDVVDVPAMQDGFCVSNVFQSHMVLQRDKPIVLWGWADPGSPVEIEFAGVKTTAIANENRRWNATLPAMPANAVGQALTVANADEAIVLDDILLGDVWILGGQSNMEFELAKVENGNLEIVSANFPKLRILTVPYGQGPEPRRAFARLHEWSDWFSRHFRKGDWLECTPENVRELSAIGYVFARRVHKAANIPIGVIDASRGGTTVETWTPLETLRAMNGPRTKEMLAARDAAVAQWDAEADLTSRIQQHEQWLKNQKEAGNTIPDDRLEPPSDSRPGPLGDHNFPGNCYAGMIAPLAGLSVKGIIFHQGYNNAFDGSQGTQMYREVLPEMIRSWRTAFNDPNLPFGILSLCTDGYPQTRDDYCEKMFNAGIEIREAQYKTFLAMYESGDKNIGFASTYDLRRRWYHPQLKLPAGERIARWALSTQYGFARQLQWKPPMVTGTDPVDGVLHVSFDAEVGDPEDGAILGFAIAGEDRQFHPASVAYFEKGQDNRGRPQYDRKKLVLSSIMVPNPTHFRYAWGRNPLANLQMVGNKDLPVATQRSDRWLMEEVPLGVLGTEPVVLPISRGDRNKIIQALRAQDKERAIRMAKEKLNQLAPQP